MILKNKISKYGSGFPIKLFLIIIRLFIKFISISLNLLKNLIIGEGIPYLGVVSSKNNFLKLKCNECKKKLTIQVN